MITAEMDLSAAHQRMLLDLARTCIRQALRGAADQMAPASADPVFNSPAGCFVSLHDHASHRLRGCVGRLDARTPLIRCIYEMSSGVLGDPRFRGNPVTIQELPRLDLELSILTPMKSAPTPLDFDPLRRARELSCRKWAAKPAGVASNCWHAFAPRNSVCLPMHGRSHRPNFSPIRRW